jgi:YD repeat-containing protein
MKRIIFFLFLLLAAMNLNAQSVSYSYDSAGNRTARLINLSKSPAAPDETVTALPDLIAEKSILIYPNPTKGIITVDIKDYVSKMNVEFRLTDLSGKTIISRKAAGSTQTLDLSHQASGIYLLHIRIHDESVVWKIIKE